MITSLLFHLLHIAVLVIQYVIPSYQSFLALARKETDSVRSYLQYWVSIVVIDWLLIPIEPIYERLVGNMDYIKLPFLVWFTAPHFMGYQYIYKQVYTERLSLYYDKIEGILLSISDYVKKYITIIKERLQNKHEEKKEQQ